MLYLIEILKLDSALEILYLNKDEAALTPDELRDKIPFKMTEEEMLRLLDKFKADNHLTFTEKNAERHYLLTYEGVKFYKRGGYLKDTLRHFLKECLKMLGIALGVISTIIGIALGLRELL